MAMLSGVFYPIDQLPGVLRGLAHVLPLTHAIELARPLFLGRVPEMIPLHVAVLVAYAVVGFYAAVVLFRRRLLK